MKSTNGKDVIPYDEENQSKALEEIAKFTADQGNTDILTPLKQAQELTSLHEGEDDGKLIDKRIFVLTGGNCDEQDQIFEQCQKYTQTTRVYSIGLGDDCDKRLCKTMAASGAGTCSLVPDKDDVNLDEIIIVALQTSLAPVLKECAIKWQHQEAEIDLGTLNKDQTV